MTDYEITLNKHRGLWHWGVDCVRDGQHPARIADSDGPGYKSPAEAAAAAELAMCRIQRRAA
jgi:hypothetical protein